MSAVITETYTRKPFEIEAVRVTAENMEAVAEWCGGVIQETSSGKKYIQVDVIRPLNDKQTKAFVDDWLLQVKNSFKVYTHKAFTHCFDKGTVLTNYRPGSSKNSQVIGQAPLFPAAYPEPSTR